MGMSKEEDQYAWLKRRAENGGFDLLHVSITRKEKVTAKANKNSKTMTFYGIQFEGVLQITDPAKFGNTIINGIGSGKALGFGFLTISKI